MTANPRGRLNEIVQDFAKAGIVSPRLTVSEDMADFEKRYGSDVQVSNHLFGNLDNFPKIRSPHRIREIESLRRIGRHISACATRCVSPQSMDYPHCEKLIWEKMSDFFIFSWRKRASNKLLPWSSLLHEIDVFIDKYSYPVFALKLISPRSLLTGYQPEHPNPSYEDRRVNSTKSHLSDREIRTNPHPNEDTRTRPGDNSNKRYILHPVNSSHSLEEYRLFGMMSIEEKCKVVESIRLFFICLGVHFAKDCRSQKTCTYCSKRQASLLFYGSLIGIRHETPQYHQPANRRNQPHD